MAEDTSGGSAAVSGDIRTRGQRLLDQALGTVIGVLVIGFFAILWNGSQRFDRAIAELTARLDSAGSEIRASMQVFSEQLAQLRVRDDRVVALSEAVKRSEDAIVSIREQFARVINEPLETIPFPAINAPAPTAPFPQKAFEIQGEIQDQIRQRSK